VTNFSIDSLLLNFIKICVVVLDMKYVDMWMDVTSPLFIHCIQFVQSTQKYFILKFKGM